MVDNSTPTSTANELSYARNAGREGRAFLKAEDYQGKITLPEKVIAEAKASGKKGVYGLVTIDASNDNGAPVARGFHVFQDVTTGKMELIPFVSGGAVAANVSNARAVEATFQSVLPGLVADRSGVVGDGINYKGVIEAADATSITNDIGTFDFWIGLQSADSNRGGLGGHNNFNHTGKSGLGASYGCPVVEPKNVDAMRRLIKEYGLKANDTYYIFDTQEVVNVSALGKTSSVNPASPSTTAATTDTPSTPPSATPPKLPTPEEIKEEVKKKGSLEDVFKGFGGDQGGGGGGAFAMILLVMVMAAAGKKVGNDATEYNTPEKRQNILQQADIEIANNNARVQINPSPAKVPQTDIPTFNLPPSNNTTIPVIVPDNDLTISYNPNPTDGNSFVAPSTTPNNPLSNNSTRSQSTLTL